MKTIEQSFADWESEVFGHGYGTGEEYVMGALKGFCDAWTADGRYGHGTLEKAVTAPVAWLLIDTLIRADVIEYGTSPRYGWATHTHGKALVDFVRATSLGELIGFLDRPSDDFPCMPEHCNCPDEDCRQANPFWPPGRIAPADGAVQK